MTGGGHQRRHRKGGARAHDGADIVRVGHLIEQHYGPGLVDLVEVGLAQRPCGHHRALVNGVRAGNPVDFLAMHDVRRHVGPGCQCLGQARLGILGALERGDVPARVGQRLRNGVQPENDVVRLAFAQSRGLAAPLVR